MNLTADLALRVLATADVDVDFTTHELLSAFLCEGLTVVVLPDALEMALAMGHLRTSKVLDLATLLARFAMAEVRGMSLEREVRNDDFVGEGLLARST